MKQTGNEVSGKEKQRRRENGKGRREWKYELSQEGAFRTGERVDMVENDGKGGYGITSRWTRRLAFTVSEAPVVANGERAGFSDRWTLTGKRGGRGACLSATVGQFKPKIQKVN